MADKKSRELQEWHKYALSRMRLLFIDAIRKVKPAVFDNLHGEPLNKYRESTLSGPMFSGERRADFWNWYAQGRREYYLDGRSAANHSLDYLPDNPPHCGDAIAVAAWSILNTPHEDEDVGYLHSTFEDEQIRPGLDAFLRSLEQWSQTYRIRGGWILHWAFLALDSCACPNDPAYRCFGFKNLYNIAITIASHWERKKAERKLDTQNRGVEADDKSGEVYAFEEWQRLDLPDCDWRVLEELPRDKVERATKGKPQTQSKRVRREVKRMRELAEWLDLYKELDPAQQHYEWLAQHRVCGLKWREIARKVDEEGGVRNAAHRLARLIGLR